MTFIPFFDLPVFTSDPIAAVRDCVVHQKIRAQDCALCPGLLAHSPSVFHFALGCMAAFAEAVRMTNSAGTLRGCPTGHQRRAAQVLTMKDRVKHMIKHKLRSQLCSDLPTFLPRAGPPKNFKTTCDSEYETWSFYVFLLFL